jgi:hypothetical protein
LPGLANGCWCRNPVRRRLRVRMGRITAGRARAALGGQSAEPLVPSAVSSLEDRCQPNPAGYPRAVELCDGVANTCGATAHEGCDDDGDGDCDARMEVMGAVPVACPLNGPRAGADFILVANL